MSNREGQQMGNYRLVRLLGDGGSNSTEVYLGEHSILKTQAAIKVLDTELGVTAGYIERFYDAARILARLRHPHIVQVLEAGSQDGMPFLVMNYAPNGTLRRRHPKGSRLPIHVVIAYLKQIVSALQYMHYEGLIHQNIKPEALLVAWNNDILLGSFGVAVVARGKYPYALAGTPRYMAPEQIKGEPCSASDQYALGIMVYEWLCGEQPFMGTSFTEVINQHVFVLPPPLRKKLPTISPAIEQAVMRALEKEPLQRFANVQEFAAALERAYYYQRITLPFLSSDTVVPHPGQDDHSPADPWTKPAASSTRQLPRDIPTLPSLLFGDGKESPPPSGSDSALQSPWITQENPWVKPGPSEPPIPPIFNPWLPRGEQEDVWGRSVDPSEQALHQGNIPTMPALSFEQAKEITSPSLGGASKTQYGNWQQSADALERSYHLEVGQQLGEYHLICLLARSLARVYLGEHVVSGEKVAMRVLNKRLMDNAVEELCAEARIIGELKHPHIVRLVACDEEGDNAFLITVYAPNGTLRQHILDNNPRPLAELLPYLQQTASALEYIHEQGLVHCDIKPENILLGSNNEAILCDFGLAVELHGEESVSPRVIAGTPPYMSPERIQGSACSASDQYALGVIVYEWLSGMLPFNDPDYKKIIEQHLSAAPPALCERVPTLSPAIEEVVLKALAKDPQQRFATVQDFVAALEEASELAGSE